jgi:Leucine-rich repeat (LRR) protein
MFRKLTGAVIGMFGVGILIQDKHRKSMTKQQLEMKEKLKEDELNNISDEEHKSDSDNKSKLVIRFNFDKYSYKCYGVVHKFKDIPDNIICLDLSYNGLETMPELHHLTKLEKIKLNNNNLSEVPEWISKLSKVKYIDCGNNIITKIPENLPSELEILYLNDNLISEIPKKLPAKLYMLYLANNVITKVPNLQLPVLTYLDLSKNCISELPSKLPPTLFDLNLANNSITKLPNQLPPSLGFLNLKNNLITKIPNQLPTKLFSLKLSGNKIITIPDSIIKCEKLQILYLDNNRIVELPKLPVRTRSIHLDNNPIDESELDLSYLPKYEPSSTKKNHQLTNNYTI